MTDILISKGTALVVLGKFNEAIKMFDKAIEKNPNNVIAYSEKGELDYYLIKGIALYGIGEYYEAIKMFDLALAIDPYYFKGYLNKGDNDIYFSRECTIRIRKI